jgi:hypothetical protein
VPEIPACCFVCGLRRSGVGGVVVVLGVTVLTRPWRAASLGRFVAVFVVGLEIFLMANHTDVMCLYVVGEASEE